MLFPAYRLSIQAARTFAGISKSGSPTLSGTMLGLLAVISKNFANPEGGRALIKGEIIFSMLKLMEVIPPFKINIETINKSNLTHLYIAGKFNY